MRSLIGLPVVPFSLAVAAIGSAGGVPTATQILDRTRRLYESSSSYQGELRLTTESGNRSYSQTILVEADIGPHGIVVRSRFEIAAPETPAGAGPMRTRMIDDGKWIYVVDDTAKQYFRRPHVSEPVFAVFSVAERFSNSRGATVSLAGRAGQAVYVVSTHTPTLAGQMRILKSTGELLSIRSIVESGGHPSASELVISKQIFGGRIPAQSFEWKAPLGYKKEPDATGSR